MTHDGEERVVLDERLKGAGRRQQQDLVDAEIHPGSLLLRRLRGAATTALIGLSGRVSRVRPGAARDRDNSPRLRELQFFR
jgi:hypothetical protein